MNRLDLVVKDGPLRGMRVPIGPNRQLLGRSSSCDIKLDDAEVSRRHLFITPTPTGVVIADAGSTNGTFLGGEPVHGEIEVPLGAPVALGSSIVVFEIAAPPELVRIKDLARPTGEWSIPIGVGPHGTSTDVDLSFGHIVVIGPYRSGRTNALTCLASRSVLLDDPPDLHLLAPKRSSLTDMQLWRSTAIGYEDVELAISGLGGILSEARKAIVLLDDADLLFEHDDLEFERILRASRDSPVRFVIAAESTAAHRTFGGWFVEARKQRHALILQADPALDGDLFGTRLPSDLPPRRPGCGYLIARGEVSATQVAAAFEQEG